MALAVNGGMMHSHDRELHKLQTWYRPKRIRERLEGYRAILYPYIPEREDERGMPIHRRAPWDNPLENRVVEKADIDRALIYLQYVAQDLDAAETVRLYYLTLNAKGEVHTQEQVADIMGCTERTVRNRLRRAIDTMSFYLGSFEDRWERLNDK